jgi:hypothetical protein
MARLPTLKNRPLSGPLAEVVRRRVRTGSIWSSVHPMHVNVTAVWTRMLASPGPKVMPLLQISIRSFWLALLTQFRKAFTVHAGPGFEPRTQLACNRRLLCFCCFGRKLVLFVLSAADVVVSVSLLHDGRYEEEEEWSSDDNPCADNVRRSGFKILGNTG